MQMNNKIGLVISTLNEGIFNLKNTLPVEADEIIIVHQVVPENKSDYSGIYNEFYARGCKIIPLPTKGLSLSRNTGLYAAISDYVLICDDDGVFEKNLFEILRNAIQKFPDAEIFSFQTKTPDGLPYKKYPPTSYQHSKRSAAKVSSIEILIKRSWLLQTKLKFDERFGLGSNFPTGEEFIFLSEAINSGAKVLFIPEYIVTHAAHSSGKHFTDTLIKSKGALFARTYGWKYPFVNLIFALKKYDHYKNEVSFFKFLKLIFAGSSEFRRL